MEQDIRSLDPEFDFLNVFRTNSNVFQNVRIVPVEIKYTFLIDNVVTILSYAAELFEVRYRVWMSQTWVHFKNPSCSEPQYWSSFEKAENWFHQNRKAFGIERVTQSEALSLIRQSL